MTGGHFHIGLDFNHPEGSIHAQPCDTANTKSVNQPLPFPTVRDRFFWGKQ